MLKAEQIPDECFDAAMTVVVKDGLRAAIAAAINAWPGGHSFTMVSRIVLPLPQGPRDE